MAYIYHMTHILFLHLNVIDRIKTLNHFFSKSFSIFPNCMKNIFKYEKYFLPLENLMWVSRN